MNVDLEDKVVPLYPDVGGQTPKYSPETMYSVKPNMIGTTRNSYSMMQPMDMHYPSSR